MVLAILTLGSITVADTSKLQGMIKARNGDTMTLQVPNSSDVTIVLTDNTEVSQIQGVFQARRKEMAMAALIPGLEVQVEVIHNDQNQFVAKSVKFKGNDFERAQSINAGMHETRVQTQKNQEELARQNVELEKQNAELKAHKAAIDAAVARFGQLDDYYILDEVTVQFGNGKVDVDPKFAAPLLALGEKAKTVNGYMIEVKGYASSVGSAALNQQLSEDRADNVTNILIQQAHIPLTRMLAPGAMGESQQVGNDQTTEQGQAENRRVVVRILQNKAIAGV
jgi:outer membrane protein OmpA-like peptidoglycan-associated protein